MVKKKKANKYIVYAKRQTSQFNQQLQEIHCHVLEAHNSHLLVESLKRYNKKYSGAQVSVTGKYKGKPVRRINRDQVIGIVNQQTGKPVSWNTVRRREGTNVPGRANGGI